MDDHNDEIDMPGGPLANRPLRFIWVVDCSGSMEGEKIGTLNYAVRETLPEMNSVADDNPSAAVEVQVLSFASGATWVTPAPVPLNQFAWTDLTSGGVTDLGHALDEVADQLDAETMPQRGLPPVIVLLSDGQPTDNYRRGIDHLLSQPWGRKAVRLAIGIGSDADHGPLKEFIANSEIPVVQADHPADLVKYIRWASTSVLQSVSAPGSRNPGEADAQTPMAVVPTAPPQDVKADAVW